MLYDPKWAPPTITSTGKVLQDARRRIDQPSQWCRQYADGHRICAVHAIQLAAGMLTNYYDPVAESRALKALGTAMGLRRPGEGTPEGHWNDSHTHAEVLAAFDRAIAAELS